MFRLLDVLSWEEEDSRERFELTQPADELEDTLAHLLERSEACLVDCQRDMAAERARGFEPTERDVGIEEWMDENLDIRSACRAALAALGVKGDR